MTLRRGLTAFAALALAALGGVIAFGWLNGYRAYAVESGSMSPTLRAGDLVIDEPAVGATYRVGDVITFHPTPAYTTTHRIVALDTAGMTTQGDANPSPDLGRIPPSAVIGRVAAVVPFGGYVAAFFRQPAGIAASLLLVVAVYLLWEMASSRRPTDGARKTIPPTTTPVADD